MKTEIRISVGMRLIWHLTSGSRALILSERRLGVAGAAVRILLRFDELAGASEDPTDGPGVSKPTVSGADSSFRFC